MANTPDEGRPTPRGTELYAALRQQFDVHHEREGGGGTTLTYVTGEQVISRLNDVLGIYNWQFDCQPEDVRLIEFDGEPFEFVASGRLGVYDPETERFDAEGTLISPGQWVWRSQCGSQQVKFVTKPIYQNGQKTGDRRVPLELGYDAKGAVTDCLKKCAAEFGVALYLWDKEEAATITGVIIDKNGRRRAAPGGAQRPVGVLPPGATPETRGAPPPNGATSSRLQPRAQAAPAAPASNSTSAAPATGLFTDDQHCAYCGEVIKEYTRKPKADGSPGETTSAAELITWGKNKHGAPLCMGHYSAANKNEISKDRSTWPAQQPGPERELATPPPHAPAPNGAATAAKSQLESLRTFISRTIDKEYSQFKETDAAADDLDKVTQLLWEAAGEQQDTLLEAIFGPSLNPLSKAEALAIQKWSTADRQWINRAQAALKEFSAASAPATGAAA